jgi:hypothetical protein
MIYRTQRGAAALLAGVFASALVGLSAFSSPKPAKPVVKPAAKPTPKPKPPAKKVVKKTAKAPAKKN